MAQTVSLMGFRIDGEGRVHAAFKHAPVGRYAFELGAPKTLLNKPPREQDLWAQKAAHARGDLYDGLYHSDLRG